MNQKLRIVIEKQDLVRHFAPALDDRQCGVALPASSGAADVSAALFDRGNHIKQRRVRLDADGRQEIVHVDQGPAFLVRINLGHLLGNFVVKLEEGIAGRILGRSPLAFSMSVSDIRPPTSLEDPLAKAAVPTKIRNFASACSEA